MACFLVLIHYGHMTGSGPGTSGQSLLHQAIGRKSLAKCTIDPNLTINNNSNRISVLRVLQFSEWAGPPWYGTQFTVS